MRVVAHFIQQARPHGGVFKRLQTDNLAQIIKISGDAVQACGVERLTQFRQRLRAVIAVNDDFGDHRIVKGADLRAGADPAIDPHAVREMHVSKLPRRRLEVFQRIFGIETHFNRRALRCFCEPRPVQRLARGHINHALDKIQPRHGLGYRVLHLKAGVDLQKPEAIAPGVIDKLHGACAAIIDRFAERHRGGVQGLAGRLRQTRRGRLFHHFLVTTLERTVALAERRHVTLAIAQDLHFQVTRTADEFLYKHAVIAEKLQALASDALPGLRQRRRVVAAREPDAAAARGGFQHHRVANIFCRLGCLLKRAQQPAARRHRHARLCRQRAGAVFQAKIANLLRRRADEYQARGFARRCEFSALGKKTVAGENRLRPARFRRCENFIDVKIGVARRVAVERDGDIGIEHMLRVTIRR